VIDSALRTHVRQRAGERCEYCHLRQEHSSFWHLQIEHIVPKKHDGTDDDENLALACARCNLGKSSNLTRIDSETGDIVLLFNPRKQDWVEHFAFRGAEIVGLTPTGRATVHVLNMNEPNRLRLRAELLAAEELD